MSTALESFLAAHEEEILSLWQARFLMTRPADAPRTPAQARETVRAAFHDLLAAAGGGPNGSSAAPTAVVTLPRAISVAAQPEALLALVAGRDVLREYLGRELLPAEAATELPILSEVFTRVIASYGRGGCAHCLSVQDESRARVERRLETVVEHSLDAIVLCDQHGVIEAWNRGAAQLLGRAAEDTVGRSLALVAPPGDGEAWLASILAHVRECGHARYPETLLTGAAGERIWVDASYTCVRDPSGREIGLWAVFRDMTEQRRLMEDNLQAERLALIGTMSAKFAHEIRNPLASILLNLDLIRDSLEQRVPPRGATPGEDEEIVGSIAREVERIQHVVQDYLRFARLPRVQRHPVDLDDIVRRGLAILAPELKQQGIALELALASEGRAVAADGDQIWQAILNLVRNSMEALPRGGRILVATRPVEGGVECTIEDDGPGIPVEVQERIFVPFFSTKHAGTGLGLPFVRQVLNEHHSALRLTSALGQGARFSFVLPDADAG